MLQFLVCLSFFHHVFVTGDEYRQFWLCQDISDANYCFQYLTSYCIQQCCSIHDNKCTNISNKGGTVPIPPPQIHTDIDTNIIDSNSYYHNNQCLYETMTSLYDLKLLQINPLKQYSHFLSYHSMDNPDSPFYDQQVSMYINICNRSSVFNTSWNNPPNTNSLFPYLHKSITICGPYASNTYNDSAVCTNIGNVGYQTPDFSQYNGDTYNGLKINLGKTTCLWTDNGRNTRSKQIDINLIIECDKTIENTQVISVEGPSFCLDEINWPCDQNITIVMRTNIGSCPRDKIFANSSYIHCPKHFNETTQIINCTLYTQNNQQIFTGNMNDFDDGYLSVAVVFGTEHENISLSEDINIDSNETGIFNITLNMTAIAINKLNETSKNLWQNISMYASAHYPMGPNTTTPNATILFEPTPNNNGLFSSKSVFVFGWICLAFFIFLIIHLTFR